MIRLLVILVRRVVKMLVTIIIIIKKSNFIAKSLILIIFNRKIRNSRIVLCKTVIKNRFYSNKKMITIIIINCVKDYIKNNKILDK